jgi:hypothetical protein
VLASTALASAKFSSSGKKSLRCWWSSRAYMLRASSRAHAVLDFVARTPQAAGLVVSEASARSAAGCHLRHAAFSRAHAVLGFAMLAL